MKIIALEAENVKHLKVVHIKPDGSLVVVGGDNSAGKSCALDSIQYALDGASSIPDKPIRKGENKARIKLDLGDIEKEIEVVRTFTQKGTNLVVKNKDGATFPSPQAMLDKLKGELAFDPLEFSRMDTKEQAEVLKKLVGLNFDKVNGQYEDLFSQRTIVNRQGKELKANLDNMVKHDGVLPDQELSIQELGEQYAKALEHNQKIETAKRGLKFKVDELQRLEKEVKVLKADIKKRQKAFEGNEEIIDDKAIHTKMADAESINTKVRENRIYAKTDQQLAELRKRSGSLGTQMAKIVSHKAKALAKAKFPIEGLAIEDDGDVTFECIPFSQCSTSQQIRISVAIGLAMNPKLRVLLIREGSSLDEKNLAMVAKMADDADAQIWIERVSKGKECQIIIEDGSVLKPKVSNV